MTEKEMQVHNKQEVAQAAEPTKPERVFVPPVDIYETDEAVTVVADMPGVDKDGISIDLENGVLTIRGTKTGNGGKGEKVLLQEFETGHYLRQFTIAETIDQDKIEATMANGVLTLVLPKVEPARPRKIAVKAG